MKLHQSGYKIIVTELNPMGDESYDKDGKIILLVDDELVVASLFQTNSKSYFINSNCYAIPLEKIKGWLPMPVYDPSQKQPDDFNRGVRVMFDYMKEYQEWLSLHQAYAAGAAKYKLGHDRYEKLRKLNPRQFDELYARNLSGENFDEMVDKL